MREVHARVMYKSDWWAVQWWVRTLCRLNFTKKNLKKREYFFFFNDTATTEIYTLSLHDALPIYAAHQFLSTQKGSVSDCQQTMRGCDFVADWYNETRNGIECVNCRWRYWSEWLFWLNYAKIGRAHVWTPVTFLYLVCRLLLEKKKAPNINQPT